MSGLGGCPVPKWAKRMVPGMLMMVDRWKVPDQIASEDPAAIGYRGRIRMKGKAGVIAVHICPRHVNQLAVWARGEE